MMISRSGSPSAFTSSSSVRLSSACSAFSAGEGESSALSSASEYERGQLEAKIDQIIKDQIGIVFAQVLEHAGVYKDDDKGRSGFDRFIASLQ